MKTFNVEAEWHMELFNKKKDFFGHRVKVSVLNTELGFYINGMVVCPPETSKTGNWEVYTPKQGNARIIEFNGKESKLWHEIKEVCIDAVKEHLRHEKLDAPDNSIYEKSESEFNKQMMEDMEKLGF